MAYALTSKLDLDLESNSDKVNRTIESVSKQIGLVRIEQKNALKLVLLNFFWFNHQTLIIPRARQKLAPARYNPSGISYSALRTVLDRLVEHKLITQKVGYKDLKTKKGKTTTVAPTYEFMGRIAFVDEWKMSEVMRSPKAEVIRIREDKKTKDAPTVLLDYEDNDFTRTVRKPLQAYNKLLANTDIWLLAPDMEKIKADLGRTLIKRTFVRQDEMSALTFGGRMYGPWCDLTKDQRKRIWMNDAPVVEHDFPSSHINVMYRVVTGKPYSDFDADLKYRDAYDLYVDGYKVPRSFVKKLSSILINTDKVSSAVAAIRSEYISKKDGFEKSTTSQQNKKAEYEFITSHAPVKTIIQAYLEKHEPIAWWFLKGKMTGLHIQYWESQLVMKIISKLVRKQIPVLTVYDSFIINEEHEELLLHLMDTTQTDDRILPQRATG